MEGLRRTDCIMPRKGPLSWYHCAGCCGSPVGLVSPHRMLVRHAAGVDRAGGHSRGLRTARGPLLLLVPLVRKAVPPLHPLHLLLVLIVHLLQAALATCCLRTHLETSVTKIPHAHSLPMYFEWEWMASALHLTACAMLACSILASMS